MHFGSFGPHQPSNVPDQASYDAGRSVCDARTTDVHDSNPRDSVAGRELPPQITEWMRRKKRNRRAHILKNSASWAVSLTVTSLIITVTVWLLPVKPPGLRLWHEQAQRMLEAIKAPKTIELTADEPIIVPVPKAVSRRRWSNL